MPASLGRLADVRFIGPVMGRYTLESRARLPGIQIFAARLQSISPTMMVASAPVRGKIGELVSTHYTPFGHVRGRVARHIDGGFVLDIEASDDDRRKLASRIDWFKKRTFSGLTDKREHSRFMPREPKSAIVLHSGAVIPCLVIDISCSGAAISADYEPITGEPLAIGKAVGRVVRRLEVGFAVQFVAAYERETVEEIVRAPDEWEKATALRGGTSLTEQDPDIAAYATEALQVGTDTEPDFIEEPLQEYGT
jgi:hypothetical protein